MYRNIFIMTLISQLMNECWISVECKDNRCILCKQSIILTVRKTMWMFAVRLKFKQVYYVNYTNLQFRHCITKNCCSSKSLKCWCITTTCHNKIRLSILVVTSPFPNTDTLCTVFNSLLHCQPLFAWMFGCNNCINIVLALYTVIKAGKQAVCIWWKVHTYNVCLLVSQMI